MIHDMHTHYMTTYASIAQAGWGHAVYDLAYAHISHLQYKQASHAYKLNSYDTAAAFSSRHHAVTHIVTYTLHQQPVCVKLPMCVLLQQAVDLALSCRDKFVEFSYLRSADKKHGIPEHLEKTVLFLVDASPVAKADADAQDLDAQASSAKAAEEEAAAAVKAAWHAAKEAKEVLNSVCHLCCACDCPWNLVLSRSFTCSQPCVCQAGSSATGML